MGEFLSPGHIMVFVLLLPLLYFVPTVVAWRRKVMQRVGVLILNLLLGWTVLGWVGALVWAVTGETEAQAKRKEIDYDALAQAMTRQNDSKPQH